MRFKVRTRFLPGMRGRHASTESQPQRLLVPGGRPRGGSGKEAVLSPGKEAGEAVGLFLVSARKHLDKA
ncbi:hypothetical protein SLNWT_1952 [Streptomyces albus]|uniref:Uncharacterized protein n=1 Tax=Streptomyces albus (strain ATCC 21838 / DSM 41398 / FERM P-419 / JCM 4703 / NBRC 107858) TaxID=1081613 RepID=A0A0B5EJB4_STRA4|nr:hypothetical protein SLNWT_1952 [Streptomyces albus]AOU76645.1 hypothetical protein SLNHY_1954 [Streptomyces albus]AYN32426.1 hypothetical protein DUI70_1923 [Streptomyces albus]